ncbi:DUF2075 domain-containing protein [Marinimicrobium alkaliphilum]|uniref:DUF2075 domain-containing protein n=1 Tax=Marinimicrobium alkaliphilum TaxID=2202654 RepID=UPI001E497DAE|nr:DUF2075 domain-containing protein [Marinimicrobium alkaliphilum]
MNNSAEIPGRAIRRWMYGDKLAQFLRKDNHAILGELLKESIGSVEITQRNAWDEQIRILKSVAFPESLTPGARIYFELTVPRLGRRADVVLIIGHIMFILEFKAGESSFNHSALDQVWDYALDFKNFHETSHDLYIIPVLIATEAPEQPVQIHSSTHNDGLTQPTCVAPSQIASLVQEGLAHFHAPLIDAEAWECGRYMPTPTIVEAARALYAGHAVEEISRSDAGAQNLQVTAKNVDDIIERSRSERRKAICFVTGVPGAGKTLVGLDVATRHLNPDSETYSVFLSGNGPLVAVLREALTRDRVEQSRQQGMLMRKGDAKKEVEAFIQNVHHFRDEYLQDPSAPHEHVVLFDEAQRAWTLAHTSSFMQQKKGKADFNQSEPEFLISCLDRHHDWSVVICLVGSGQEINTGEAGISEWFDAILNRFQSWDVYLSSNLTEAEYRDGETFQRILGRPNTYVDSNLHLATSMRSFRAETLSRFVREVLDLEIESAKDTLSGLQERYPIVLTRNLARAKQWLRQQARGTERYGIVVSSRAERLKPHAIDVRVKTDPVKWFLEGKDDTRSSFYLEDVATEFQVQGLELDWACVVWDGDLRYSGNQWAHNQFRGSRWTRINKTDRQRYLENTYRVLLTRARQGMVVVVPEGDDSDPTRPNDYYDPTYNYLKSLGLQTI